MKQCPYDGADIADDRVDCGRHGMISVPANADPLQQALALAKAQLAASDDYVAELLSLAGIAEKQARELRARAKLKQSEQAAALAKVQQIQSLLQPAEKG